MKNRDEKMCVLNFFEKKTHTHAHTQNRQCAEEDKTYGTYASEYGKDIDNEDIYSQNINSNNKQNTQRK